MSEAEPTTQETFTPEPRDIVYTLDPDNKSAEPTLAFVVRKATREDKIKYVLRQKSKLEPGEELEKKTLREWFKEPRIYLCIEDEEVTFIHHTMILRLAHRSGQDEAETEQPVREQG